MCALSPKLFDRLIKEIDRETIIKDPCLLPNDMVSYTSDRTGCKAYMSYSRYLAITSLGAGLRKKYIGGDYTASAITDADRHLACVTEFLRRNTECEHYNMTYDPQNFDAFVQLVRGEVMSLLAEYLDGSQGSVLNLTNIARGLHVGPGSNAHVRSDAGTFSRCMNGKITFSSKEVYQVYRACTHISPLTHCAEAVRREMWGGDDLFDSHAVFLSVPKNIKKNRAICKQPSGNMMLQLSTHDVLCGVLKRDFDCDLEDQQFKNRALAFLGSLGSVHCEKQTWEFCTADLTTASDFPFVLIEDMYPLNWSKWLMGIRSSHMSVEGELVYKHMLSSMGNGFTFANMTVFLSAIVKVLYRLANLPEYDVTSLLFDGEFISPFKKSDSTQRCSFKTWAVYGDDIIVDKRVFSALVKVLTAFGFVFNREKSFSDGFFRESCGGDYYLGYNVRPVFCENLQTPADVYSLLNRLINWGVYHSVELPSSIAVLRSALGPNELRVPNWEDVSCGFHVPVAYSKTVPLNKVPLPYRKAEVYDLLGNQKTTRFYEALTPICKRRAVYTEKSVKHVWRFSDIETHKEFSWVSTPVVDVKYRLYFNKNFECKWVLPNLPGILACTLEGSIRAGHYGVRSNTTSYENTYKVAPFWGDLVSLSSTAILSNEVTRGRPYRLWEEYIARNAFKKRSSSSPSTDQPKATCNITMRLGNEEESVTDVSDYALTTCDSLARRIFDSFSRFYRGKE